MASGDDRRKERPWLTRAARAAALVAAEGASVGLAAWASVRTDVLPSFVRTNELQAGRARPFVAMAVAVAAALLLALGVVLRRRALGLALVERVAGRASPLAVAWFVPFVFDRSLWDEPPGMPLALILAFGWAVQATLRSRWATAPVGGSPRPDGLWTRWRSAALARLDRPRAPLLAVLVAAAAYAAYFSALSVVHHRNLGTRAFDLALEENLLWHVVHGGLPAFRSTPFSGPTGTHFGNHATFFSYALAPLYALAPRAETLLVVQAIVLGAAAVPLFLYARRHLPGWTAALVAGAYLAYPPVHSANLYDFHYLPLGALFVWLALFAVEDGRRGLAVASVVLALSVREDVGACLSIVGLFLLLTGTAPRAGAAVAAAAGGYFVLMKMWIMPYAGGGGPSFVKRYAGLLPPDRQGFGGVLETAIGNPTFIAKIVLEREKLLYLLQLLTPLLFLPLARPAALVLLVPGVLFTLLATGYEPLYSVSFQYTSYWTILLFVGVVHALEHAGQPRHAGDAAGATRRRALAAGLAAASLASTTLFGAIVHRDHVRTGFDWVDLRTAPRDLERRADLAALVARIGPDDRVVGSEMLLPHVATRSFAYRLSQESYDADWLLFETDLLAAELPVVRSRLELGIFGVVDVRGAMVLAERGAPTDRNAEVLGRLPP